MTIGESGELTTNLALPVVHFWNPLIAPHGRDIGQKRKRIGADLLREQGGRQILWRSPASC